MLSYLELTNFKSFSHVLLDLRGPHGEPKKTAFIYGENGSGKSNLMQSVFFISQTLRTLNSQTHSKEILALQNSLSNNIRDENLKQNLIDQIVKSQVFTLSDIVKEYRTIGSNSPLKIKLGFRVNGKDGFYALEFHDDRLSKEEFDYQISERSGTNFKIEDGNVFLSPTVFLDSSYNTELLEDVSKYWGKHSFLSIIFNEYRVKNKKYLNSRLKETFVTAFNWLKNCSVSCKVSQGESGTVSIPFKFMRQLERGRIPDENDSELKASERALDTFFTSLYSDIKSAHYVFKSEGNETLYELYFTKLISGKLVDIPVRIESTGTQKLLDIFPVLVSSIMGNSAFVDEVDTGIHDLLMINILDCLQENLHGQFIATTHNTVIMDHFERNSSYVIRVDGNGNKEIVCISDYPFRTQKNNSIQRKYLNGEYDGVPYVGNLDLGELVEDIITDARKSPFDQGGDPE